jgi:acyl dehydratase
MAMDPAFVGRSFPFADPYPVGAAKIREFAEAIGDPHPLYLDRVAAHSAGHPDVVAPPTFAMLVVARAQAAVLFLPELGLDFARVVHGDQRFVHHRPINAGDLLSSVVHIDAIRVAAGNDILSLRIEVTDPAGAAVCTAYSTLVSRAAA